MLSAMPRAPRPPTASDSATAARAAHLRYVSDARPGLRRLRHRSGFRYIDADGAPVRDEAALARIRSLAIPPAWTDVWIAPSANGHIQATGRDARGRKQYRYHPRWRALRDENKYGRMAAFGRALPALRERVEADLRRPGMPREKVLATVVRLLETTLIRVGNDEYARDNDSFGLTTMRDRHVDVQGGRITFAFRGKSGRRHRIDLRDRRLANIVRRSKEIPGYELFQYIAEDGSHQAIDAADVNAYLREATGDDVTAKDFRTWAGSVLAARALAESGPFESEAQAKRNVVRAIEQVAGQLGNTPAVCRQCYVHPAVLDAYLDGSLAGVMPRAPGPRCPGAAGLGDDEHALLALLERRAATTR